MAEQYTMMTLRIDVTPNVVPREQVVSFISTHFASGVMVLEVSEKEKKDHYQGFVYFSGKKAAMRKQILRKLFLEPPPQGTYSFSEVGKKESYERYVVKGRHGKRGDPIDVLWKHGIEYTDEWLATMHEKWHDTREELHKKRKTPDQEESSIYREVVRRCVRDGLGVNDRLAIAEHVIDVRIERKVGVNKYKISDITTSIQGHLDGPGGNFRKQLALAVYNLTF